MTTNFVIRHYPVIDSTQERLKELLRSGEDVDRLVLRADVQRVGKGQRRSDWSSPQGGSYQSIALQDSKQHLLSPVTSVALAYAVCEGFRQHGVSTSMKWPNDIYRDGGKLAGILCEYLRGHLIIGVGVNVTNPIPQGASAVSELRLDMVHEIVLGAVASLADLLRDPKKLITASASYDYLRGKTLRCLVRGEVAMGKAIGIGYDGSLLLQNQGGGVLRLESNPSLRSSLRILSHEDDEQLPMLPNEDFV